MLLKSITRATTKLQNLKVSDFNIAHFNTTQGKGIKKKHFFFYIATSVALTYWIVESAIHYFAYNELAFNLAYSNTNELRMRISVFILLIVFGLLADYAANRIAAKNIQTDNIFRAKKQWELVIDSLPQLVIAMDHNARITRVNKTVETWGAGKVNEVVGLYVSDFLKCLNDNFADDAWTSDWSYIWQTFENRDLIERKIEKECSGKIYHYSLRKISDYNASKDPCYAVLIIDDITARQIVETSLKDHAQTLEEKVNTRTKELRHANNQLELELQAKKIANINLKESQDCRLALLRDIFTTQEKERKRIACELHDSIGQTLGATKFITEELLLDKENSINDKTHSQLNKLVKIIKNAIHEVRNIAMDLRPVMIDDLGLLPTLKWFCREYENTYTQIKINLSLHVDESTISAKKKIVIFRIVQEAMNNIAKHANASNITLIINESESGMTISISDNGCGFDTNLKSRCDTKKSDSSFGLNSMRERAESTNGKFQIKSTPDKGTSILISWEDIDVAALDEIMMA